MDEPEGPFYVVSNSIECNIYIFRHQSIFFSYSLSLSSFQLFFSSNVSIFDSAFDTMYRRKTRRQFLFFRFLSFFPSTLPIYMKMLFDYPFSLSSVNIPPLFSLHIGVHHPPGVVRIGC
jgi:hypothetical protein